ncbi:hypothetical protein VPH35_024187 [Triticum aestivum]|uniref:DUF6598 domain-containing protein n=1 Tax=Triticum turgidum subsp. durum TaxID=4567 RepID=A0A9R1P700_TRITD|nr:uncharacterized protein LOC123186378 isoform X1 [Triticum aestivum]VAH37994.1 unnamed protein product [Triticum turgidum subsp. durum]
MEFGEIERASGKEKGKGSGKEKVREMILVGELRKIERVYEKEMKLKMESGKEMDWVRKFRKLDGDFGEEIVNSGDMNLVRRFRTMERKYREEMEIRSKKDMGRTTYVVRNKREDTFRSSTKTEIKRREATFHSIDNESLADALCRHIIIQRREITALERQVESRGLETIAGKKAYLERQRKKGGIYAPQQLPPEMIEMSKLSVQNIDSDAINLLGVSLPYLVLSQKEALHFLLHECHEYAYRIQSFASILRKSSIPIRLDKLKKLRILSETFVAISDYIKRSCEPLQKEIVDDPIVAKRVNLDDLSSYHAAWKSIWGSQIAGCGSFDDITTLSPMQFTHSTPGIFPHAAVAGPALQIFSIKIVNVHANLRWPLRVYGVVAARDIVDRNRNLLFSRSRANCQEVTEADPFLLLTGPSRAIVAADTVKFEVELRIMYAGADTKDTVLFSSTYNYYSMQQYANPRISSCCGMLELSVGRLTRAVQATIVGVRVVEGEWPFQYGCRVSCYLSPDEDLVPTTPTEVVLVNCKVEEMEKQSDGYVNLSRNVVSVQLEQTLKVVIQAYSESGLEYLHNVEVDFPVKQCQTTKCLCTVGNSTVQIVVAWSLLAMDKLDLVLEGYVTPV